MESGPDKMPVWARIFAAAIGLTFLAVGVCVFFKVHPLGLKSVVAAMLMILIGMDYSSGSILARWPYLWWF
jgi:hypothetical protein